MFEIGDIIQLKSGVERCFSSDRIGKIVEFFSVPMSSAEGCQYAKIEWEDGTTSSMPVVHLEMCK